MNVRPFTPTESANLVELNEAGLKSVPLFVTATALHKGILDATEPMRALFREAGFHDYLQQSQGQENKIVRTIGLLESSGIESMQMSLYRPKTKNGDPRFWIYGLKERASHDDVFALFFSEGVLHAVNLTRTTLAGEAASIAVKNFLRPLIVSAQTVADELLDRLRSIASSGPIKAVCTGDTAIGRSIEARLGISMNSSLKPDYNGIELKAGRSKLAGSDTRATLFACVPNWQLSACKSSDEILTRFGYQRGEDFKLYCSVSARRANSQGLQLRLDEAKRWLKEIAARTPEEEVAIWEMDRLQNRLTEKHRETFWIKARAEQKGGDEWFHLQSVTHTRNPNLPQLGRLLGDGTVTLDHLIKRKPTGGAHEKGPLFKIERDRIPELFLGLPKTYSLAA